MRRLIGGPLMIAAALLPAQALADRTAIVTPHGFAPDAPIIGAAVAGNGSASVSFLPPLFDGGGPVLDYQARCGGAPVTGSGSPIIVAPLVNGVPVTCTVTARNQFDTSAPSAASNSITPRAPTSLQLSTSGSPNVAGTPLTFSAQITPNTARGSVSFFANAAPIGGCVSVVDVTGTAVCNTSFGSIGTRAITANYSGDAAHFASTGTLAGGQEVIAPVINITTALNDAATAVPYGPVQLLVSAGASPLTFSVTAGSLPTGLTLSSAGLLSGVPTVRGSYSFTVTATDANGFTGERAYSVTLRSLPGAPAIGIATAGNASVSVTFVASADDGGSPITTYNAVCSATASNPTSPITVTGLTNGVPVRCRVRAVNAIGTGPGSPDSNEVTPQAPTTLLLQTNGTPATAGATVTITATLTPASAAGSIAFTADTAPISGCGASPINSGSAVCNTAFNSVGTRAISASYSGDAAHIASAGTLAGGQAVIAPIISISTDLVGGILDSGYGPVQLVASGGLAPHGFTVTTGTLPIGLSLSSAGVLSGTPTATVLANFTITASDANGFTGARPYSMVIATVPNAPAIVAAAPLNAAASIAFNPPANNGNSAILDYTASCTPGVHTATGNASPIVVGGLSNQLVYRCAVRARNAIGTSLPSAELSVIPGSSGSTADVSITKSNGGTFVNGGAHIDYLIVVTNPGPAAVIGARVQDALAPDFSTAVWDCTPLNNAACPNPASGSGALDAVLDLPAGSSVRINFSALPVAGPETPVSNIASVIPPAGITDPSLSNNVATDGPDVRGVFRNDFE
jgi:trimeric autotransporter adhesin